jgi:Tfp pilus assembly protein PilX
MRNRLSRICCFPEDARAAVTPRPGQGRFQNQGVALIITLLLLFLLSVVGLAAVMSSSSDLMINGYYRNYRGSFYAADSGLNMARQAITTYFNNNSPATWPTTQTAATTAGGTLATSAGSYVTGLYGNSYSLNNQGQGGSSVPSSFSIITATVTLPNQPSGVQTSGNYTQWSYVYNYTLQAQGTSQGSETAQIIEKGAITVNITAGSGTTSTTASFAAFGAFIDSFSACQGPLVQGYMTGPMYALGQWNLSTGSNPGYTFTDPVSQTGSQFSYYDGNNCYNSSSVPYTDPLRNTVNPSFQSGYNLNAAAVPLPPNSFSQQWAVLDGKGCGEGSSTCGGSTAPPAPTNTQMNAVLKNVSQTAYPSSGASSGVYLPYTCTSGVCSLNSNAGGIYVEGGGTSGSVTTTVTLSTTNGAGGSSNPSGQVYRIVQGSTTTTVTIDSVANTTTVVSGSTTLVLSGVPQNQLTSPPQAATMVYVNGDVNVSGPSSGAAIQNNSMVNVTANGDITQTNNILYAKEPVTTSANQIVSGSSPACCNGTPADTLIPQNQNMNQVLGLFTANGNFVLNPSTSGANIETDASVCMLSQAGVSNSSIGHMATGNSVGAWTNIGGRMENRAASVSMSSSNIYFDRRFQARNFAPPWFPSTTVTTNMLSSTITASSSASAPSRTFWQYQAGQ